MQAETVPQRGCVVSSWSVFPRRQRVVNTVNVSSLQQIHLKSLAVSEGPPQPTKGSAANSTRSKHAARQKKKTRQKCATTAERRQPSDIYENFNFHIGGASREDDAANAHDEDDACAIYNNV